MLQPRELMHSPGMAIALVIRREEPPPGIKMLETYTINTASVEDVTMGRKLIEIGRIHVQDPRTFVWESAVIEDWAGGDASFPAALHNLFRAWWNR